MQSRGQACLSWLSFKDFLKQLLCVTIYLFLMTEILREIAFVWGWSKWCPKNCLAASHFHNCIKLLFSLSDQLAKLAETGGSWQYTQLDLDRFSTVKQANKALTTASEIRGFLPYSANTQWFQRSSLSSHRTPCHGLSGRTHCSHLHIKNLEGKVFILLCKPQPHN